MAPMPTPSHRDPILPLRLTLAALLALATLLPPRALAAQSEVAPAAGSVVIPLHPYAGRLRTVRVLVAGDSLDFLFDTGGGVTVVSPAVAERIGCTPTGRRVGFRMTGERLDAATCPDVPLAIGGVATRGEAGVFDMMALLGRENRPVHGMISLRSFAGRTVTVDLVGNRLVLETPATLAERTRGMTPVRARVATGQDGSQAVLFVGLPVRDRELWLELDSAHQLATFLAPHSARLLGLADSVTRAEIVLPLAHGVDVRAPVIVKDVIYDGVLSGGLMERGVWTLDLARGHAWVGAVAPLLAIPARTAGPVAPPVSDPVGYYEMDVVVDGRPQPGVMRIERRDGRLVGELRGIGEEDALPLQSLTVQGNRMEYVLMLRQPTPVRLTFRGVEGTGTWGDGPPRTGAARTVKRT
jgi:hypothetical protein